MTEANTSHGLHYVANVPAVVANPVAQTAPSPTTRVPPRSLRLGNGLRTPGITARGSRCPTTGACRWLSPAGNRALDWGSSPPPRASHNSDRAHAHSTDPHAHLTGATALDSAALSTSRSSIIIIAVNAILLKRLKKLVAERPAQNPAASPDHPASHTHQAMAR